MCCRCFDLYVCLCTRHVPSAYGSQKRSRSPGISAVDGCRPPQGFWELNLGPLEEQLVPLTTELYSSPYQHELFKIQCTHRKVPSVF